MVGSFLLLYCILTLYVMFLIYKDMSQFGNFSEGFTQARLSVFDAMKAMNSKSGSPEDYLPKTRR
jgi:hypothetical protein